MQTIKPFLWFDTQAEEAAAFYTSVFPNSRVTGVRRYGPDAPREEGLVMTVAFELDGVPFVALNGGPQYSFNEAVSFVVDCADQAEIDRYWDALAATEIACGWCTDRFGLTWQIVPTRFFELIDGPDEAQTQRVMAAMLQMTKFDIAELERAASAA